MAESHAGISSAMLRFSKRDVPVGQQPSSGIALTGIRSPSLGKEPGRDFLDEFRGARVRRGARSRLASDVRGRGDR